MAGAGWSLTRRATQGELPLVDAPEQFYAGDCCAGRCEILEAEHRSGSGLDAAMILLDQVVQVFRAAQLRSFRQQAILAQLTDCAMRRSIAVESDCVRRTPFMPDCFLEECLGCRHVSSAAEPKVHRLPGFVHRPVQIGPLAAYFDIGLVNTPRPANGFAKAVPPLDEFWGIAAHPTQDRRMGKMQPALCHHFDKVTEAELIAQVPPHEQKNDLAIKMSPHK